MLSHFQRTNDRFKPYLRVRFFFCFCVWWRAISSALSFMRSNIVRVRDGFRPDLRFVSDALNSSSALTVARK